MKNERALFNDKELRVLVEGSMSLYDLKGQGLTNEELDGIKEEWIKDVFKGDIPKGKKRFAWDALEVSSHDIDLYMTVEKWLPYVNKIVASVEGDKKISEEISEEQREFYFEQVGKFPFEPIMLSILEVARGEVERQCELSAEIIGEKAYWALQKGLLRTLLGRFGETFLLEFKAFQHVQKNMQQLGFQPIAQDLESDTYYQLYIEKIQQGGFKTLLQEYPVMSRLLSSMLALWVETTVAFYQQLQQDYETIEKTFWERESHLGPVINLTPSLSDPHNGNKSVMILEFEEGLKLVYKPKSVALERDYFQWIQWLNEQESPRDMKVIKVLDCGQYGWVEFLEHKPCQSVKEVEDFYYRSGMQLCLAYGLEATDCIYDNVIASGAYPVMIDLESLLHHQPVIMKNGKAPLDPQQVAGNYLWDSVLRTHYLPRFEPGKDVMDISALGGGKGQQKINSYQMCWEHTNEDLMKIGFRQMTTSKGKNLPCYEGKQVDYKEYRAAILAGFRDMYQFIMDHKTAVKESLALFKDQQVRYLFRNTRTYAVIQSQGYKPDALRSGLRRSKVLDQLSSALLRYDEKPYFWPLLKDEHQVMEHGDIPYFYSISHERDLYFYNGQVIKDFFKTSSYENVLHRLHQFTDKDLQHQLEVIRGTLALEPPCNGSEDVVLDEEERKALLPLSNEEALEEAVRIGDEMLAKMISSQEGLCSWIGLVFEESQQQYVLRPVDEGLYDGIGGIGVFLSALYKKTGYDRYSQAVKAILATLKDKIGRLKEESGTPSLGIGGGLGSMIYVLTTIGDNMKKPELYDAAYEAAMSLTKVMRKQDHTFDVLTGSAGALLAILKLIAVIKNPAQVAELKSRAIELGDFLLENRQVLEKSQGKEKDQEKEISYGMWEHSQFERDLTGMSHGSTGIGYSLLKLYDLTGDGSYLEAVKEVMDFEEKDYSEASKNWQDRRYEKGVMREQGGGTWCHGAPGIALSRLGMMRESRKSSFVAEVKLIKEMKQGWKRDVQRGLDYIEERQEGFIDHLCCGHFGVLETVLTSCELALNKGKEVQEKMDDLRLEVASRKALAKKRGQYGLNWVDGPYNPTLFQGMAGIGYSYLRLIDPKEYPSILLFR